MSFGQEIKRERELRSISLREVSEATKVNVRYLEAMERDEFETLPGGVFNRGFVRAYAEYIGVDPESMVNAYLLEEQARGDGGRRVDPRVLRGTRKTESTKARPAQTGKTAADTSRPWLRWGLLGLILFVVVLAALLWFVASEARAQSPRGDPPAVSKE